VGQLGFQRVEERFHVGVLVGRPASGHALPDTTALQTITEWRPKKLAAAIAVEDEAFLRATILQRRMHNSTSELRVLTRPL